MSVVIKYLIFQVLIIAPFITGSVLSNSRPKLKDNIKGIIKFNLIFMEPVIILWSTWGLTITRQYAVLPFSGLALVLLGLLLGHLFSPFFNHDKIKKTTFLISSSLANHGFTMGGFLCFIVLGEKGLGLSSIFFTYFSFYTYLFIMSYANYISTNTGLTFKTLLSYVFNLRNLPVLGAVIGISLSLNKIQRPDIYFPLTPLLLITVTLYFFSLGLTFKIKNLASTIKENIAMSIMKFLILPGVVTIVLFLVKLEPVIKKIIFIESFAPAAVYSVMVSALFDLDTDLASSMFVINTVFFLMIVFPFILFLLNHINIF